MQANIQTKHIYWYYGGLLVLMFLLMNLRPHAVPMTVRWVLTLGFLVPIALESKCIVFAFSCVWAASMYSFSPILPEFKYLYLGITLLYLFVVSRDFATIKWLLLIWLYFSMVCLVYGDSQKFVMMTVMGIILSLDVKDEEALKLLNNGIIIASLFFSLLFLLNKETFAEVYVGDLERSSWTNANTFGSLICCGSVLAVGHVTKQIKMHISKAEYVLCLVTALLGLTVLIMNASRGALFSFAGGVVLFVVLSRTRALYKVLFVAAAAVLVFLLYRDGYFELLEHRMEDNVNNVGNRSGIWQAKLEAYSNFGFWDLLFGRSRHGVNSIQSLEGFMSTHNDFITALVGYGLVGFLLYLGMYVASFLKADADRKLSVFILLLVLAMEASVVEPIFRGNFVCIMFFVFIYKYATISFEDTEEEVGEEEEEELEIRV